MDPVLIRAAFGLAPDATDDELFAAMRADPHPLAPGAMAAYAAQRYGEGTTAAWMTLESRDVVRTALSLLEFWAMSTDEHADFEATKILCMDTLGVLTKADIMRVATAVASLAFAVLTPEERRAEMAERIALEIAVLMDSHERRP